MSLTGRAIMVSFSQASNTYENWYLDHIRFTIGFFPRLRNLHLLQQFSKSPFNNLPGYNNTSHWSINRTVAEDTVLGKKTESRKRRKTVEDVVECMGGEEEGGGEGEGEVGFGMEE